MAMKFSERLQAGIAHISSDCASDALADFDPDDAGCSEEELLAETALDASRLKMWGYEDADAEVKALVEQYGYEAVLQEATKWVYG